MRATSSKHLLATLLTLLMGCPAPPGGDEPDTFAPCVPDDSDLTQGADTADTGPEPPPTRATLRGIVDLQLRTQSEEGDLIFVAWKDSCFGEVWPYGSILVAAWVEDEATGETRWLDTDVIQDPSQDPSLNEYELVLEDPGSWEVHVAAFLDKWQDQVIGTPDPVAPRSAPVRLEPDDSIMVDVDLVVDTPYWCAYHEHGACPDCPPWWGDGAAVSWEGETWVLVGSGCCGDTVDLGGTLELTVPYNGTGQDGLISLLVQGQGEPFYVAANQPLTGTHHGAMGEWGFTHCAEIGTYDLRGAWDANGNGLWEFTDPWGKPADVHGTPYDTITVEKDDLLDLGVMVPVEDAAPAVVPEISVTGVLGLTSSFDQLLADHPEARLWIAAMRVGFELEGNELQVEDFDEARDHQRWEAEELAGAETLAFELTLAGHAPVHLGAWLDLEGDEVVGEKGEPATWWSGGSPHGLLDAGDEDREGLAIEIRYP